MTYKIEINKSINSLGLIEELNLVWPLAAEQVTSIRKKEDEVFVLELKSEPNTDSLTLVQEAILKHTAEEKDFSVLTVDQLKVSKYSDIEMWKHPFNLFDFKRHLRPPMSFNKVVNRAKDGRPLEACYYIENELLCRVQFVFTNQPGSVLMHRRAEVLNYVKKDGTWTPDILIKKKTYDMTNPNDLFDVIGERESSRNYLIKYMSGAITGILLANHPTWSTENVAQQVQPFMQEVNQEINDFITLGSENLKQAIAQADTQGAYTWLADEATAGVSLQMFMLDVLTYTTENTFPSKNIAW